MQLRTTKPTQIEQLASATVRLHRAGRELARAVVDVADAYRLTQYEKQALIAGVSRIIQTQGGRHEV